MEYQYTCLTAGCKKHGLVIRSNITPNVDPPPTCGYCENALETVNPDTTSDWLTALLDIANTALETAGKLLILEDRPPRSLLVAIDHAKEETLKAKEALAGYVFDKRAGG